MNKKYICLLFLLAIALPLIIASCSGSQTTAPPSSNSTSIQSQPEAPPITIPAADKTKLPVIQFSAAPASIAPGATAVLSWNVTNATSVTIDHGVGTVSATGTKNVSPAAPTTYKLTAANAAGSAIKTVSVAVIQAPATTPPPSTSKPSK